MLGLEKLFIHVPRRNRNGLAEGTQKYRRSVGEWTQSQRFWFSLLPSIEQYGTHAPALRLGMATWLTLVNDMCLAVMGTARESFKNYKTCQGPLSFLSDCGSILQVRVSVGQVPFVSTTRNLAPPTLAKPCWSIRLEEYNEYLLHARHVNTCKEGLIIL